MTHKQKTLQWLITVAINYHWDDDYLIAMWEMMGKPYKKNYHKTHKTTKVYVIDYINYVKACLHTYNYAPIQLHYTIDLDTINNKHTIKVKPEYEHN
ncbi:hypothetical protein THIOSC15_2930027 [uncultured Thiomicrorhabdus sp.]